MRKGRDGGKKQGEKKKIWMKIVATIHCQQSTARTPTAGTPHACANNNQTCAQSQFPAKDYQNP